MITKDRQYRSFEIRQSEEDMTIEGYAVVFEQETVLYEFDGVQYKEKISRNAFDGVSLDDVVLNFNHGGKPIARTKNATLQLDIDSVGVKVKASLKGTEEGRNTYEEVKGGYLDKMSFAFIVEKDSYDSSTHTRTIEKIKRWYDVAIVDFPAYEQTSVSARSFFKAEAEKESLKAEAERHATEVAEIEKRKAKLKLLIDIKSKF